MRAFREFTHEAIRKILSRLGNTNISSIGDGTVTGGIDKLHNMLGGYSIVVMSESDYQSLETKDANTFYCRPKE